MQTKQIKNLMAVKISLDELAEDMVLKDLKLAENEKFLLNKGR